MSNILSAIQSIDFAALDFIQSHMKTPALDAVMPFITHLASLGIIWIILAVILLCIKKRRREGVAVSIALILCFIVCNVIIKNVIARTRPFDINTMINLLISKPGDFSFPSGHTAASFGAAMAVLLCGNKPIGIPALIVASVIAFSRLYLYVHFPSDVISGVILGIAAAYAARKITRLIYKI